MPMKGRSLKSKRQRDREQIFRLMVTAGTDAARAELLKSGSRRPESWLEENSERIAPPGAVQSI
jgi:hypothetical protein